MAVKGTFPQATIVYGTYQWLQLKLGIFLAKELGTTANFETNDSYQNGVIDHIIQSGVHDFYTPVLAPGQKRPYPWSFLKVAGSITQVISTSEYTLPAEFAGWVGDFTSAVGGANRRIKVIYEGDIRASQAMEDTDADPQYVCVRAKQHSTQTAAQTFEVSLFPTPDAGVDIKYRYTALPAVLTATNKYPAGVQGHAETIAAACLAKAESEIMNTVGPMNQLYMQRLQASVMLDSGFAAESQDDDLFDMTPRG